MTRTAAQRYNAKMEKIFEESKILKAKYAPAHAVQLLERMTEKIDRAKAIQKSWGRVTAEDWAELYKMADEARNILEYAKGAK